jgi:hypothetical protein
VGTIKVMPGGAILAVTPTGEIIGEFPTMRQAIASFGEAVL